MKPQTTAYLDKSDQALDKARRVLQIDIPDEAGRHAYYAQFHAAQALIFERTGTAALISPDDARTAIAAAENFVAVVRRALKP